MTDSHLPLGRDQIYDRLKDYAQAIHDDPQTKYDGDTTS